MTQSLSFFLRADGQFVSPVGITSTSTSNAFLAFVNNSLGSPVNLSSTATTFLGPTVSQGTSGTWFVSGTVGITDTGGSNFTYAKLWDGTTIIDSGVARIAALGSQVTVSLSGVISAPVGNINISCNSNSATGVIAASFFGYAKDSTLTAIRIG